MKNLIAIALLSLTLAGSAFTQNKPTGPFGFAKGMTREQVIQLVGKDAVKKNTSGQADVLIVTTAPIPNRAFEEYLLIISPTQGLLKLSAIGADVTTGDTGSELMSQYDTIMAAISTKYGEAKAFNTCTGNDTECDNSQFFMMTLHDKNRTVEVFWTLEKNGIHPATGVTLIMASANYSTMNSGYVRVSYEFEGFDQYADQKKAEQDKSY
jgi:hypothetical protein